MQGSFEYRNHLCLVFEAMVSGVWEGRGLEAAHTPEFEGGAVGDAHLTCGGAGKARGREMCSHALSALCLPLPMTPLLLHLCPHPPAART